MTDSPVHRVSLVMLEALGRHYAFVQPVWLSRNYGQHTGMASASGNWIVTLDEDGQQDPKDIAAMLDTAIADALQLVYAQPTKPPPHGWLRNASSRMAKAFARRMLGATSLADFNSFRLIDAEIGRTLAACCGNGVYLDVGLFCVAGRIRQCPVTLREEQGSRPSLSTGIT